MIKKSFILLCALIASNGSAIADGLRSKLDTPIGAVVTVEGIVGAGPDKGYEGGDTLFLQKIDGRATQKSIRVKIAPYWHGWGEKALSEGEATLPELKQGATYRVRGYSTGSYVGIPYQAFIEAGIMLQTSGHYFSETFMVYKAEQIKPITFSPTSFTNAPALLLGIAKSRKGQGTMTGDGWSVVAHPDSPWPKHVEGKRIETFGTYSPAAEPNLFKLADGDWWLVNLGDQAGRQVALRGRARSMNGEWWFYYRGNDLYVEDMKSLPNWDVNNHWRPMVIKGRLEKEKLPRIDQISLKEDRDLKEYFIVKDASWEPLDALLAPEEEPFLGKSD